MFIIGKFESNSEMCIKVTKRVRSTNNSLKRAISGKTTIYEFILE